MNRNEALVNDMGMRLVKLCIILGIMFLFRFLISHIKVFDEMEFFNTGLTVLDVVIGAVNAIILVFLIKFGFYLTKHYEMEGFPKAMVIAKWIVMLIAAIIAYQTFYHIAKHIFRRRDIEIYNVSFLVISLLLLTRLGVLIFSNMEKITDIFTGKLKVLFKDPQPQAVEPEGKQEVLKCKSCSNMLDKNASFCPKCGAKADLP